MQDESIICTPLACRLTYRAGSWVILRILQAYRNVASEYVQIGHRPRAVAERAGPGNPGGAGRAGSDAPAACHRDRSGGARGDRRCAADRGWPSSPGACKAGSLERARRRPWSVEGGVARTLVAGPLVARTLVAGQLVAAGPRDAGRRLPVALSGDGGPLTSPLPPCSHRPAGPVAAIGRRGRARRARSYAASVSWPMRSHA